MDGKEGGGATINEVNLVCCGRPAEDQILGRPLVLVLGLLLRVDGGGGTALVQLSLKHNRTGRCLETSERDPNPNLKILSGFAEIIIRTRIAEPVFF